MSFELWPQVLLAIVLVTLLGIPARNLVGALAGLLRVPAVFTRTDIDPVLHRAGPSSPNRLMRSLRDYFRPVLDRPARGLGTAAGGLFVTAENAPRWPVGAITGAIVGLVSPLVDQAATHAENGSARLGAQARAAAVELRGSSGRWAGWRVIGGVLFFAGLCLFLYADAALSIASHEKAIGAPVSFLPEWFRAVTLAYAIARLLAALVLRAVHRALPPAAVLLGGLLRLAGIAVLVVLIGLVAIAAVGYFAVAVLAVGVVFAAIFAAVALWAAVWLLAYALVYAVRFLARVTDAVALALQRLIDAFMYPGKTAWNWLASFDRMRALHLRPIAAPDARPLRLAPGEPEVAEEAAR